MKNMATEIESNLSELERLLEEVSMIQIINNSIFLVWWSDNGWTGKCKEPDANKVCKTEKNGFGIDCAKRERGCSTSYLFKCYGMYIDEGIYNQIEPGKYTFFISKNPADKKYYIIGYFLISDKGEGVAPDCRKWLPEDYWNYYIKGDKIKSRMIYDYSNSNKNIIFDKEFIKKNTTLDLDWNKSTMENMSDDGKIGSWFRTNRKAISDEETTKVLQIIKNRLSGDSINNNTNTKEKSKTNLKKHANVYETLFNELSQNKFHSFEELNQKWNNIKFLENPHRKEATIPTRWLFEYILRKCKTPYGVRFLETERAIINLLRITPSLNKQIKNSASNLIANMVFERGYTHFKIPDRYCLILTLNMFNKAIDENYKPDDIFQAIMRKKSTKDYIDKNDFKRLHNLIKTFPDKMEALSVIIPEETLRDLDLQYQLNIVQDIKTEKNEDFDIIAQISEEDKKNLDQPRKRNSSFDSYIRNQKLAELMKELNGYQCQVCKKKIPKKDGGFYIESHHIIPLSEGGEDNSSNLIIVCPNHHAMMHYSLPRENISITISDVKFSVDGYNVLHKFIQNDEGCPDFQSRQ